MFVSCKVWNIEFVFSFVFSLYVVCYSLYDVMINVCWGFENKFGFDFVYSVDK